MSQQPTESDPTTTQSEEPVNTEQTSTTPKEKPPSVREHLQKHLNEHWQQIVSIVAHSPDGTSLFIRTTPGKDEVVETESKDTPLLTIGLFTHNKTVYMSYSDHKDGVYKRLINKDDDGQGDSFFVCNDENRLAGPHLFKNKESGAKIVTQPPLDADGNPTYLKVSWMTGIPVQDQ